MSLGRTITACLKITAAEMAFLRDLGGGSVGRGLRVLLEAAKKKGEK